MIGKNQITIKPEQYPKIAQFLSRLLETAGPLLRTLEQEIKLVTLNEQMVDADRGWSALLEIIKNIPEDES